MTSYLNNALSGLLAAQRALQTTSSNIANSTTEGYARQRVVQVAGPVVGTGQRQFGLGTQIIGIERIYDQLLASQLTSAKTSEQKTQIVNQYALRLDGLLGDPELGIASNLQSFYAQASAVANDPTSNVNRQQLLDEAQSLAQRLRQVGGQLDGLENEINQRLTFAVTTVNDDLNAIARLNGEIIAEGSQASNALLDQRQLLIDKVAKQIDVQTTTQPDGGITMMMSNGMPLVLGPNAFQLGVQTDSFDPSRLQITHNSTGTSQTITRTITGGEIGGMLAFRTENLDPMRRELGMIALGVVETTNAQNRQGMDLDGALGGDIFASISPEIAASPANTGAATVSATFGDASAVQAREYELSFSAGAWSLKDSNSGAAVALTGTGTLADPFVADGLELVIAGGAPAAGDKFRILPVSNAADSFSVVVTDPRKIAAAKPLSTSNIIFNVGNARISEAAVDDLANPNLLQSVRIEFDDPPSTYTITDSAGAPLSGSLPYTSGDDISFNGWTVSVTGTPVAGDVYTVGSSGSNNADNSNAIALGGLFSQGFFAGGQVSIQDRSAQITTAVGSYAARSSSELNALGSIRQQLELDVESVSGVNLDEEAVNMLKYQEAYLASSKMISVANDLFQSILNALR